MKKNRWQFGTVICLHFFLLWINPFFADEESPSIAFVHIGNSIPDHTPLAVRQARFFNPDCPIYVIASNRTKSSQKKAIINEGARFIDLESLPKSQVYKRFIMVSCLQKGLFQFSTERFFVLYDFMRHFSISHLFHMENDIMLYRKLDDFLPIFKRFFPNLGATFDCDSRCIAGFFYISKPSSLKPLLEHFTITAPKRINEMFSIASFKRKNSSHAISSLPIIFPSYSEHFSLKNRLGHTSSNPAQYSHLFDEFRSIFDAAAIGQYLDGVDRRYSNIKSGFINERSLFDPSKMDYTWELDEKGRKIPFMHLGDEKMQINNLHIHSKNLKAFLSLPD